MVEADLKTKITQLQMATEKSDAILNGNKKRAIARHGESLKETIAVVNKLRLTVEAENISKETSAEEIKEWNKTVENTIEKADDWPRFWNLFSKTIDKSGISPINKFAYLQELLCDKAKRSIEALPRTAEGYNRAISILKDRFGKKSEVVKTYVKEILDLPHIATANTRK
ncbi:Hypothetical predicted protein [Paramuricea clavata]|uniref:Uncharacterized protein n=1 Tax=Paramuricea clavata TaxID=317549 RepID=A0A6S7IB84_PARCT|nr:Hypothetical predicted protein [Paramuricea clavata]